MTTKTKRSYTMQMNRLGKKYLEVPWNQFTERDAVFAEMRALEEEAYSQGFIVHHILLTPNCD